jgi:DNA (cytosine-5)-methyltransferase 1
MSDNHEFLDKSEYTLLDSSLVKQQPKSGLIFCGYRNKGLWKKGIRENTEHLSRCHRQPNRIYSVDGIHPTIPSQETSGRFFIYIPKKDSVRKLTINECYKLMGFPDNYILNNNTGEQYKQIGNSVAVPVIQAIAESLIEQGLLTKSNKDNGDGRGYIQSEQLKIDF